MDRSIAGGTDQRDNLATVRKTLSFLCWLVAAPALAAGVEFEARLWAPDLAGLVQVDDGVGGTAIDLGADLGIREDEALEGRLIWRPTRRTSVRLDYASFDFGGDAQLARTVTFSGTTFDIDAQATSRLELEYGGLGLSWQFLSTRDGKLRLGPLVEARGLRGEGAIDAVILGILPLGAREEFELAFAAAGLLVDVEPNAKLHLYGRWSTSVEADEGDLTDLEAGVRFYPLEMLALTAGYRRIQIDVEDGDDRFDFELDGPFFGGVLSF